MVLTARMLFLICATSGCWAFSFGVGSQVVTHWLKAEGCSDTIVGVAHACYYFGVAAGSCAVPWLTRRLGPMWCTAIGVIAAGVTLAAFPLGSEPWAWCILRFVNGWVGAMSLVPLEAIVSCDSPAERKTINFAFYGVSLTVGGALGIALGLHLYEASGALAFALGGCVPLAAGVIVCLGLRTISCPPDAGEAHTNLDLARNFFSYGTAGFQGFLEGGMLHFLSPYLIARGFSIDAAGILMGVMMIGVILFQVPVGWLADRWGTTRMLALCYAATALGLLAIPWLSDTLILGASLLAFGAFTGAMYPLGLSLLGDKMPASALPRAYAWYLAIECLGSLAGAAATGKARDLWGDAAMFAVGFVPLVVVMTTWLVLQMAARARTTHKIEPSPQEPTQTAV